MELLVKLQIYFSLPLAQSQGEPGGTRNKTGSSIVVIAMMMTVVMVMVMIMEIYHDNEAMTMVITAIFWKHDLSLFE